MTIRLCDPKYTNTADAARAVGLVLPYLLDKGLVNDAEDVRYVAVDCFALMPTWSTYEGQ